MIDDSTAAVSFETLQDCMLVVGIYDEAGETMLASGSIEVYAGETDTYVDIETDSMPEYFYLKAFLIDTDCFRPVCNAYESPNYTQEMQEFLAKTTEDFDQEKVLNLDDDNTNNFAVFSEDTKVIPQTEDTNDVVSVDDENNVYVVENADSSITSLQAGDTFAYEYGDNDALIVKVADIKLDGTTATIMGEDTSLEEAFDYIKIDTESNSADAQVDASNLEDGITYEGMIESEDDSEVQTYGADLGGSADLALSFKMDDKKIGSAKVSGSGANGNSIGFSAGSGVGSVGFSAGCCVGASTGCVVGVSAGFSGFSVGSVAFLLGSVGFSVGSVAFLVSSIGLAVTSCDQLGAAVPSSGFSAIFSNSIIGKSFSVSSSVTELFVAPGISVFPNISVSPSDAVCETVSFLLSLDVSAAFFGLPQAFRQTTIVNIKI